MTAFAPFTDTRHLVPPQSDLLTSPPLLTKKTDILAPWHEHFGSVLNRESNISDEAIASLPQLPVKKSALKALKHTSPGKAPGADGISTDIYKKGGDALLEQLTSQFRSIWEEKQVPEDFKDVSIVHIYKKKGDKTITTGYHSSASLGRFLPVSFSTDSSHTSLIPSSLNRSADFTQAGEPATWSVLSVSYWRNAVGSIRSSTWRL